MVESATFWARQDRDVVEVRGEDALRYLQGQVSQDLLPMAVGGSRWTFLLQPTGKIDVLARVWRRAEEGFVIDTDVGFGEALAARLARFKIRVKADIEPLAWSAVVVRGTDGGPRPGDAVVGWWDGDFDVLGPAPSVPPDVAEVGVVEVGPEELHRARVEAGWPAMGAEIVVGETIPAETGIAAVAVSYTKGCYPGQELVERMDSRGADAPRRLRLLDVADGAEVGDPVFHDGTEVGRLTSVAGRTALARVRRGVDLGVPPGPGSGHLPPDD